MRIFTRYVLIEVLKYFLLALGGLTLLVTLVMAIKEGLSKGLPLVVILRMMPYMVPEMLGITIPVSMLYAVTSVFGRMAATNEIVALKSLGVSPLKVVGPVFLLALTLSVSTVGVYELAATWSRPTVEKVVVQSIEDIAYGMLRANRSFSSPKFSITVREVEGHKLIHPTITLHAQGDQPTITMSAEEAELHADCDERMLDIICRNGEAEIAGQAQFSFEDSIRHSIPFAKPDKRVHRDWLGMSQLHGQFVRMQEQRAEFQLRVNERAAQGEGDPEVDARRLEWYDTKINRLRTEPYRRWANGFSCLCFVLIGAPVAMTFRNADVLTSFFICFLPILIVYYPLLMIGEDLSTSGQAPPYTFWLANITIVIPGLLLLRRVIRY